MMALRYPYKKLTQLLLTRLSIFSVTQPYPKRQILDSSKPKAFADDIFKFAENDREFLKRLGNTVGKGEIARYEQFLLFLRCFQKTCTADT